MFMGVQCGMGKPQMKYEWSDTICPLKKVWCVVGQKDIWANI